MISEVYRCVIRSFLIRRCSSRWQRQRIRAFETSACGKNTMFIGLKDAAMLVAAFVGFCTLGYADSFTFQLIATTGDPSGPVGSTVGCQEVFCLQNTLASGGFECFKVMRSS